MKTFTILFSLFLVTSTSAFSQSNNIKELLNKPETRTEVFNTILNDHSLMTDFMQQMKTSEHAMMMNGNIKSMKSEGPMEMKTIPAMQDHENMMNENPEMMGVMMSNMMKKCESDSTMREKMMNMMTQNPEMMKAMMLKMKEKGMMASGNEMKMNDADKLKENNKHKHQH